MTIKRTGRRIVSLACGLALVAGQMCTSVTLAQEAASVAAERAKAVAAAADLWVQSHATAIDDPDAVIRDAGTDPVALTRWVRANTRLLAYRGVLRDWRGVLMDRAGNTLDRSLLLAELLHRTGREVRVARASLSEDLVSRLIDAAAASAPRLAPATVSADELTALLAGDTAIGAETLKAASETVVALRRKGLETVRQTMAPVLAQVRTAAGEDAGRDQRLRKEVQAALFDHYWIQVKDGDAWISLDPSAEEAGPLEPAASFAPADLPGDLRYRVTIKLVLETWAQGALNESTLLTFDASPTELAWQPITISHEPIPNPAAMTPANDPAALMEALRGSWVFTPTLVVGGKATTDRLFTTDGRVLPATQETLAELGVASGMGGSAGGAGQEGSDILSGREPAGAPDENASPVKLTAEYLDIQIVGPSGPADVQRRIVFDLLTPEERAAPAQAKVGIGPNRRAIRNLALSGVADVLVFGASPDAGWVEQRLARGIAAVARTIAAQPGDDAAALEAAMSAPVERLAPVLWSWAANRAVALVDAPQVSPVAPNVAILWQIPTAGGGDKPGMRVTFDIVANGAAHGASFDSALMQGVLDTVLETVAVDAGQPSSNTALSHAADIAAGRGWVAIGAGAASALNGLQLSPGARPLMERDLARGYIMFASPAPAAADGVTYWWRIDPTTGETIGMSATGFGTAAAEWTMAQRVGWLGFCAFSSLGAAVVHGITVGGVAMAAFCVAGGFGAAHGTGALIGKGVIELFIEILMIGGGNAHD